MADVSYQSAPKLTQTTAKENVYAPVSWLAVAAAVVTFVFLMILLVMGSIALKNKQHLLAHEILLLPAFALALAFAAYHHVKNSEGTRTGHLFNLNLVTFSIASSLLGGVGYVAYITAIEFSVRQDAENEFINWAANFKNLNASDESRKDFGPIVHKTIEPSAQQNVSSTDFERLQASFSEQLMQISQCDIARICLRNPGKVEFKPQGLVNWEREKNRIQCTMNAELVSPEGIHSLQFRMFADITTKGQRIWMIENKQSYSVGRQLTDYGSKVEELEYSGMIIAQRWLNTLDLAARVGDLDQKEIVRYSAYSDYIAKPFDPTKILPTQLKQFSSALFGGTSSWELRTADYLPKLSRDFFVPVINQSGMAPDDRVRKENDLREQFMQIWNQSRIVRSGGKISQTKDVFPVLTFDDQAIRISCPVELVMNMSDTARGRLMVVCVDPTTLKTINDLKATANPATAKLTGMTRMDAPTIPWRITQLRSDLKPVAVAKPEMPQQPSMPGM